MPNFRHRLTRTQQRVYDRSNAASAIPLGTVPTLRAAVGRLPEVLAVGDRARLEGAAQRVADEVAAALRVPRLRVVVRGTRPANARGELHGLYTPAGGGNAATILLWMLTAKRRHVVAFKTFVRTLLHELCHHLDYEWLGLSHSFHTDGFYQRESSLFRQVGAATVAERLAHRRTESVPRATASPAHFSSADAKVSL